MYLPCNVISTISKDPNFQIQTALLYVRSNDPARRKCGSILLLSEIDASSPSIFLDNIDSKQSTGDNYIHVCDDEPDLGLLHLHQDRLAAAAEALGWRSLDCLKHTDSSIRIIRDELQNHLNELPPVPPSTLESRKVVVQVDKIGRITIKSAVIGVEQTLNSYSLLSHEWMPTSFSQATHTDTPRCKVYLDLKPTKPSTLTTHKTTHRCVFTSARERLDILPSIAPTVQEVLLYNPYGEITEASCCTAYFNRNGIWITPAAICGSMLGVTRRLAIEKGLCKQGIIEVKDLKNGEEIWLSNAVRGFFKGVIATDSLALEDTARCEEIKLAKLGVGTGDAGYGRALKSF